MIESLLEFWYHNVDVPRVLTPVDFLFYFLDFLLLILLVIFFLIEILDILLIFLGLGLRYKYLAYRFL